MTYGAPNEREATAAAATPQSLGNCNTTSAESHDVAFHEHAFEPLWPVVPAVPFMLDTIQQVTFEHFEAAPESLKRRLYATVTEKLARHMILRLARVRFTRHGMFNFDPEAGEWAITLPVFKTGTFVDWAAFHVENPERRAVCLNKAFAVGFDLALSDAGYHPKQRLLLHYDAWSFLRAQGCGCLPINWRYTGIELVQRKVAGLVYADDIQARKADLHLRAVLRVPPSFVKSAEVA